MTTVMLMDLTAFLSRTEGAVIRCISSLNSRRRHNIFCYNNFDVFYLFPVRVRVRGAHDNIAARFIHLHCVSSGVHNASAHVATPSPCRFVKLKTSVLLVCIKVYILLMQVPHRTCLMLKGGDDYYRYSSPLVVGDLSYS
jgi:hypothetical protein